MSAIELDPRGFNAQRMCRWGPMLYNKNDTYIGRSIAKYGEYSWLEVDLFGQLLRPGGVVLEGGANIGSHTVPLAQIVGREGAVIAFEPQRLAFQLLNANLALNSCANVWAYQEALGASNAVIGVPALDPEKQNNFGGLSLVNARADEVVKIRTIDSLDLQVLQMIKLDIEGMETDALLGAAQTIRRLRPIIYAENFHQDKSPELIKLIQSHSYELYWHTPALFNAANFAGDAEDVFPGIVSANVLCFPIEAKANAQGFRRVTSPADRWNA